VAPTGTLSIIGDCTGGIEPAFALAFTRSHYLDPRKPTEPVRLTEVNRVFEAAARSRGVYSEELVEHLAAGGSLLDRPEVPADLKRVFVTAHEIAPTWHVRMQAAFQKHTDNAVSKTINFPRQATSGDVANAYLLAYREGCKGITIYRDGSRTGQVLSHIAEGEGIAVAEDHVSAASALAAGRGGDQVQSLELQVPDGNGSPRRRRAAGTRARNRYTPPRPALPFSEVHTTDGCPDCGAHLVFSEGCLTCRSCGFTRCG
jgi:ribonucleoside-diphosphate reductase alpha chain